MTNENEPTQEQMRTCIHGDRISVTRRHEVFDGEVLDEVENELGSLERTGNDFFSLQTSCPVEDKSSVLRLLKQSAQNHWPNETGWRRLL